MGLIPQSLKGRKRRRRRKKSDFLSQEKEFLHLAGPDSGSGLVWSGLASRKIRNNPDFPSRDL